jgi:small subunit ribosomal protein S3
MKGEVYGKRELSPLVGLSLSKSKGGNKGRKQRRR